MTASPSPPLIALAAGGTGGHVFPAEALAEALLARGYSLALITDNRGAAFRGALAKIDTYRLPVTSLAGGVARQAAGVLALVVSVVKAYALLRRLAPRAVVGFGGYPSLPTMLAATWMRLPTALHEQNAVLGRANRLVASRVDAIATSFVETQLLPEAARARAVLTGNPVRPAVASWRGAFYEWPAFNDRLRLLVTGGSQGAAIFSRVLPAALALLDPSERARIEIVQQCRPEDIEAARTAYREAGVNAQLDTFIHDLPWRLVQASLVICRAGASTIAELTTIGRPAILAPYPHATDDHQTVNARSLAESGAAWVIADRDFTPQALADRLHGFLTQPEPGALSTAASASWDLGRPDAAPDLADLVARLVPANGDAPTSMEKAA